MGRQLRNHVENAVYHVIMRGNNGQKIFHNDNDYFKYLLMLKKRKSKYNVKLFAYCLMPNHVHLLLQSKNISKFMQSLNLAYTYYYKDRYNFTGHLWQARFKDMTIRNENGLTECTKYIEQNPLRNSLVLNIFSYKYSSKRSFMGIDHDNLIDSMNAIFNDESTQCQIPSR